MPKPQTTCPNCGGSGKIDEYDPSDGSTDKVKCGACNGTGKR